MIDVSFVVPAWNEAVGLEPVLASLREAGASLSPREWEIVVVDNASTDETARVASAGGARVVHEPVRQISRARNRGAAESRGRFLLFVDADTRIPPALAREAVDALASGSVVGGGSVLRFSGGGRVAALSVSVWNGISRWNGLAAGCFLFCLREAWAGTGGFDERCYASEEIWFSLALKRWGRRKGLGFRILEGSSPETSARKFEGWKFLPSLSQLLLLNLCPWLVRSRRACFLWYRR